MTPPARSPFRGRAGEHGQASVELALVLPVLAALALLLAEVGLVAKDYVLVAHAAREGLRVAVVDPTPRAVERAVAGTAGLVPQRLTVEVRRTGRLVTVAVSYRRAPNVLFGAAKFMDFSPRVQVTGQVED